MSPTFASAAKPKPAAGAPKPVPADQPDYSVDDFVKAVADGPRPCTADDTTACKTRRFTFVAAAPDEAPAASPVATHPTRKGHHKRVGAMAAVAHKPPHVSTRDILVTFNTGSADLQKKAKSNLNVIAIALKGGALEGLNFEVAGHTDAVGKPEANQILSEKRAQSVKDFLVAAGVPAERLQTKGYGAEHLIDPQDPKGGENRRVEMQRLN